MRLAVALIALPSLALADGTVTGHARFERVKGRPGLGHAELYESNLFLSPDGGFTRGPSFRLGAPPGEAPRHDGYYRLDVPAGTWTVLVDQPLFFIRPKVLHGILVEDGKTVTANVDLPIDYSTYFTDSWTSFDQVWVQTFTATGTSITGVSWKLAGTNATDIEASVLADDGSSNPAAWPRAAPGAAKSDGVAAQADNWVRWRSGEVPTVPGARYAVKLTGVAGGDRKFAVYKRDKDGSSYSGGTARSSSGEAMGFDLNITVFSDNDGTAVIHSKTTEGIGELRDGYFAGQWGQTFQPAGGESLAAVDVWAAGADFHWDLDFTFAVFEGGPGGVPVGPSKTTRAAYQAFGAGLHGVSYSPGEVPLEAGKTYYIELTNPEGFNPYVLDDPRDAYAGGAAYQSGALKSGGSVDLSMTILVHAGGGGAIAGRVAAAPSGEPIAGAAVLAVEAGRTVLTGEDGTYGISSLPAGAYTLRASKNGYATDTRSGVVVAEDGTAIADFDLEPVLCSREFGNEGFEEDLAGWTRFGGARSRTVDTSGGEWFGGIRAREGSRFHGNEVNGNALPRGGLLQRACAVPGHRYRASVWSCTYWIGGVADDATNRIGIDAGGGGDPDGPIAWSAPDRAAAKSNAWRQVSVEAVASGPEITVFLEFRQRDTASPPPGGQWRINCFDLVELVDLDQAAGPSFIRGDCDGSLQRDLTDAIFLLNHLFSAGGVPSCDDACDANDDGRKDISDAGYILNFLFLGGTPPRPPDGACGPDPTEDALECGSFSC
jgi:hypothetical protein